MKNNKLVEVLLIAVCMLMALELVIFPGLESDSFVINVISLTSFVLLVVMVVFSNVFSGPNNDQNDQK